MFGLVIFKGFLKKHDDGQVIKPLSTTVLPAVARSGKSDVTVFFLDAQ